ncbi:MAG: pyrroloquinoline quinone biosynthesis peptide chaperone PqqD [Halieaceae bacterium]|nr:pyrroloquinoline quinone biosynthesis peptide chaperone PqqD [Halieaceae bacterium]
MSLDVVPRLHRHFRFQWEPAQDAHVLLYPEGMIKLNGSAGEILACVDGEQSVAAIIAELQQKFPEAGDLADDVKQFLAVAHDKRWIEL